MGHGFINLTLRLKWVQKGSISHGSDGLYILNIKGIILIDYLRKGYTISEYFARLFTIFKENVTDKRSGRKVSCLFKIKNQFIKLIFVFNFYLFPQLIEKLGEKQGYWNHWNFWEIFTLATQTFLLWRNNTDGEKMVGWIEFRETFK